MVSLRRRKLLGFCNGRISDDDLSKPRHSTAVLHQNGNRDVEAAAIDAKLVSSRDGFAQENQQQFEDVSQEQKINDKEPDEKNISPEKEANCQYQAPEVKRRKQHKRKYRQDREQCSMRGVYFKNMKWQAAIKVEKKQIHLGTVNSQIEAAKLYDRAAFMCGREPNYELTEEEKQELSHLNWPEFLAMTRNAIVSKKNQRRLEGGTRRMASNKLQEDSEQEQGVTLSSCSSDMDDDVLATL